MPGNAAGDNSTNVIGDYAWKWESSSSGTKPVDTDGTTGHANKLCLYDMSGNVWDRYEAYPAGALASATDVEHKYIIS